MRAPSVFAMVAIFSLVGLAVGWSLRGGNQASQVVTVERVTPVADPSAAGPDQVVERVKPGAPQSNQARVGADTEDRADADDASESTLLTDTASHLTQLQRITEEPYRMDQVVLVACQPPRYGALIPYGSAMNFNPHQKVDTYCHVYITPAGVETIRSGEGTYPVGTIIVKQKFRGEDATETELFTLMRKMPPGYDTDHGDWEYSVVDGGATTVLSRGRTESCIECHKAHFDTDFVTRHYLAASR